MALQSIKLGRLTNGTVNTPSELSVPSTGSSVTLLDGRYSYGSALVQNVGSSDILIRVDGTATSSAYHALITPNSQADIGEVSYVNVTACCASGQTSKAVVFSVQINDSVSQGATSYA